MPHTANYWEDSANYYLKMNNNLILKKVIAEKFRRNKNIFHFAERGREYCAIYVTQ
jgi:hypothetical protein